MISNDLCLTQEDLLYLLSTRRESLSIGEFRRLYPVSTIEPTAAPGYTSLLDVLQRELETSPSISTLLRYKFNIKIVNYNSCILLYIKVCMLMQSVYDARSNFFFHVCMHHAYYKII
jgi:hypothetical protein